MPSGPGDTGQDDLGSQEAGKDEARHQRAMANANPIPATRPGTVPTDFRGGGLCYDGGECGRFCDQSAWHILEAWAVLRITEGTVLLGAF